MVTSASLRSVRVFQQFSRIDRSRVSCVLGVTSGQELMGSMVSRLQRPVWVKALREAGLPESKVNEVAERISGNYRKWEEANFPGLLGNVAELTVKKDVFVAAPYPVHGGLVGSLGGFQRCAGAGRARGGGSVGRER